jgi:hypothetical protein
MRVFGKKNQNQLNNIGLGYFKTLKESTMQYMDPTHKELVVFVGGCLTFFI